MTDDRKRILIIDDDEDFRSYVYDLLTSRGYKVLTAANGNEGLKTINRDEIDIILVDMVMPEREGVETIMEVRVTHPNIKIIAMSGAVRHDTYLKLAGELGADITLSKPFEKGDVLNAINVVCKI